MDGYAAESGETAVLLARRGVLGPSPSSLPPLPSLLPPSSPTKSTRHECLSSLVPSQARAYIRIVCAPEEEGLGGGERETIKCNRKDCRKYFQRREVCVGCVVGLAQGG